MIKVRLAERYFAAGDEMGHSIVRLVESGEVRPVQISGLPIARYESGCHTIIPKEWSGTMPCSLACQTTSAGHL